jgi:hypothetical protein
MSIKKPFVGNIKMRLIPSVQEAVQEAIMISNQESAIQGTRVQDYHQVGFHILLMTSHSVLDKSRDFFQQMDQYALS